MTFQEIRNYLKRTEPISRKFGFDRGQPIDRYYIEKFLSDNSRYIKGTVLEVAEDTYTKQFGKDVSESLILHATGIPDKNCIVADLTKVDALPENIVDCFICTQTFNFIYDFKEAINGAYKILKPGGVLLATVSGISQISRYDMERWGDYWRFTTLSAEKAFGEIFDEENVKVDSFGNCFSACSFLKGMASHELSRKQLEAKDPDYQMSITIVATKTGSK